MLILAGIQCNIVMKAVQTIYVSTKRDERFQPASIWMLTGIKSQSMLEHKTEEISWENLDSAPQNQHLYIKHQESILYSTIKDFCLRSQTSNHPQSWRCPNSLMYMA
jgi:hypothetical protein